MIRKPAKAALAAAASLLLFSCARQQKGQIQPEAFTKKYRDTQELLGSLLEKEGLADETRYAVVNRIAGNMLSVKDYPSLIYFLTNWAETHPDDSYNAYWFLMAAYAYLENDAEPIAEYYFERILSSCSDLTVRGKSIHFICLQHLIQISRNSASRIAYMNQLISRFPNDISTTELFFRLAKEYEREGDWSQAVRSYTQYLDQDDASTLQITGYPNAYMNARQLINFSNSPKDWTFETLDALVSAVKAGIASYNYRALDKYKSKVNFFAMSWRQVETDANAQENFSMRSFMRGNRIRCSTTLDPSSSSTEAYLRTTGWSNYVNVWYLYFRKVNFPADPEIHGRWEWAGIYYGEKL